MVALKAKIRRLLVCITLGASLLPVAPAAPAAEALQNAQNGQDGDAGSQATRQPASSDGSKDGATQIEPAAAGQSPGAAASRESNAGESAEPGPASAGPEAAGRAAVSKSAGQATVQKGRLTPERINRLIEEGQILDEEYRVNSQINGDEVLVLTWMNERTKSKEQDCKIDAVLIARKVIDADPLNVKRVRVRYFDRKDKTHDTYDEILVVSGLVKSFAAGILGQEEMLSTLTMTSHAGEAGKDGVLPAPDELTAAAPGPMLNERRDLLSRIQNLKKNHVGVGMFMKLFAQVEQDAAAGNEAAVSRGLKVLYGPVTEQENTTRQARLAPRGINVVCLGGNGRQEGGQGMSREQLTDKQREIVANARKAIEDSKRQYGEFYPELGPMYADRYRIARLLVDLKDQGKKVDQFLPMFKEIEQYAVMNNLNMLTQSIHLANLKLGLKDLVADDQYKADQAEMDMLKQNLQRKL